MDNLRGLRILVAIANFGTHQTQYLKRLLAEFAGWPCDIKVILYTTHSVDLEPHCRLDFEQIMYGEEIGQRLPFEHRRDFVRQAEDYDYFLYTENDILITAGTFSSWLEANEALQEVTGASLVTCGLLRFERKLEIPDEIFLIDWHVDFPAIEYLFEIKGEKFFTSHNDHQGCYILSKRQLNSLIEQQLFSTIYLPNMNYGELESAASDIFMDRRLARMLPAEGLEKLLVHHLPDKYMNMPERDHEKDPGWWVRPARTLSYVKGQLEEKYKAAGMVNTFRYCDEPLKKPGILKKWLRSLSKKRAKLIKWYSAAR